MTRRAALILFAVIALSLGWFLISPLFIDRVVDEALPGSGPFPTRGEVEGMSSEERQRLSDAMTEFSRNAPDRVMEEPMPSSPRAIASGRFRGADAAHRGEGEAFVYVLEDGSRLVRFEAFRVTNGPDLVVLLSTAQSPRSAADITESEFVSLGALKGNVGSQNYPLPAGLDREKYRSIVVWCELFGVLFAAADLVPALPPTADLAPGERNGAVHTVDGDTFLAWSSAAGKWLEPEEFFLAHADRRGGLTWGRGPNFPPYAEVTERDLFLLELESGVCLMEFWHRRWRRANDVRRWNEAFNDFGGCPYVFDER
jgi:hypothetical protein